MDLHTDDIFTQQAAAAFTRQSAVFDRLYGEDKIIQYKRKRVRDHLRRLLLPASSVLELNAGTGEDAIFLARHGHRVHATDISEGMQEKLREKVAVAGLNDLITQEQCSYTALYQLQNKGPYDCIFSNFAGLNCTAELQSVLQSFDVLVRPGGIIVLVILPNFCLWEILLAFKGKFQTAFRRFFSSKGRKAKINTSVFRCWYYSPSFVAGVLRKKFDLLDVEGLCTIVPPSYIEGFADRHPRAFSYLQKWEGRLKNKWPWKCIGDYYILSMRKKEGLH